MLEILADTRYRFINRPKEIPEYSIPSMFVVDTVPVLIPCKTVSIYGFTAQISACWANQSFDVCPTNTIYSN